MTPEINSEQDFNDFVAKFWEGKTKPYGFVLISIGDIDNYYGGNIRVLVKNETEKSPGTLASILNAFGIDLEEYNEDIISILLEPTEMIEEILEKYFHIFVKGIHLNIEALKQSQEWGDGEHLGLVIFKNKPENPMFI